MKKVPFILMICTLLVSSCFYLRMYHFCEGDLEWMSPYEQGDTILFKSHEQIDTMIVQEKSIYDSYWPLMKDESSSTMNATGVLSNKILHNGDSVTNSFSITKRENNRLRIGLFFEYKGMFCDVPSGITFCKVKVNGIVLEDAILVDDTVSSEKVKKQQSCEYFIWSKSKGLIQYKYLNGDTYTFYKKLLYKKSI